MTIKRLLQRSEYTFYDEADASNLPSSDPNIELMSVASTRSDAFTAWLTNTFVSIPCKYT
jgi:hypothetical protein